MALDVHNLVYNSSTGLWVPVGTDANGNMQVALTGSLPTLDYQENVLLNAVAVTANGNTSTVSASGYRHRTIYVYNDTGEAVNIFPRYFSGTGYTAGQVNNPDDAAKTLNSGSSYIYSAADFPHLDAPMYEIRVDYSFTTAPSAGNSGLTIGIAQQ